VTTSKPLFQPTNVISQQDVGGADTQFELNVRDRGDSLK
jgi:hypothetical protein